MSLDATVWAWNQKITASQKLVLLSLADRAGENHDCWPSIMRLVDNTGLNRKTVIKVLQEMVELGLIHSRKKAFGRSNTYTLIGITEHTRSSHKVSRVLNSPNKGTNTNSPKNGTPIVPESEPLKVPIKGHKSTKESIKESIKAGEVIFFPFYERYKGEKREAKTEYKGFIKMHDDWQEILPLLKDVILEYPQDESFIPKFKNYLFNREWESAKRVKAKQWWDSRQGQAQKGKEYGLNVEDYSQYHQFLTAVKSKAKQNGELVYE